MKQYKLGISLEAIDKFSSPIRRMKTGIMGLKAPINDLGRSFSKLNSASKKLSSLFGYSAVGAITAGALAIKRYAASGDLLAKTADKLGLPIEMLQKYRFAADRAGIEQRSFDVGFQRMTRRIAEARKGKGEALPALMSLGIDLKKNQKEFKTNIEIFEEIADKIAKIEDPSIRIATAFKFFDTEGVGLVNMMKDGAKGIRALGIELEAMNGIISDKTARGNEELVDAITNVKWAISGTVASLLGDYQPKIIKFLTGIVDQFEKNKDKIIDHVKEGIDMMIDRGKILLGIFTALKALDVAKMFIDIGIGIGYATVGMYKFTLSMMKNPLGLILVGIAAGITAIIMNWDSVKSAFIDSFMWIMDKFDRFGQFFDKWATAAYNFGSDFVTNIWEGIKSGWGWFTGKLGALFDWSTTAPGVRASPAVRTSQAVSGGAAMARPASSNFQGRLAIDINAPPGTRVSSVNQAGNADFSVDTGLYMAMG
ncbi:MAG: hypothetical protein ABIK28_03480 [Planctomycetota bacterium]